MIFFIYYIYYKFINSYFFSFFSFVLKDCGSEIKTIRHDPELNNFRLNRFHTDYILAMKDIPCDEEYSNDCDLDKKDILVSYD